MYVTSGRTRVKAWAPAKLNLFLEVLGRRADGFHELDMLMLPIDLWDTLTAEPAPGGAIHFRADWAYANPGTRGAHAYGIGTLPDAEHNLAYRAFDLVRQSHCKSSGGHLPGANVRLWKRIPAEAGMGGGSSDAAAALVLANAIWDLNLPLNELERLALQLGSDVPFFLHSAVCRCRGRGEIITPVRSRHVLSFVVVKPPLGLSTARVFKATEVSDVPTSSDGIVSALERGQRCELGQHMFNRLQGAAEDQCVQLTKLARYFDRLGVVAHQMTGSGSCYFGLCRNEKHARQLAQKLNSQEMGIAFAVKSAQFPTSRRLDVQPGQN